MKTVIFISTLKSIKSKWESRPRKIAKSKKVSELVLAGQLLLPGRIQVKLISKGYLSRTDSRNDGKHFSYKIPIRFAKAMKLAPPNNGQLSTVANCL